MFQEQTLTPNEEAALRAYNLDAQNIIDMRRSYQADEYRKTAVAFGLDDPILRTGAMDGGIMRLNFSVGGIASLFRKAAKVSEILNRLKNSTFDMFNNDSDTVTISIGDEYENFDIKSDTFLTRGLKEARKKAAIKCRGLSSNFALKAV